MQISIVIPVFNSEKILPELMRQIEEDTRFAESREVFLVNDCSSDNSWDVIAELVNTYSFLTGINLRKNTGQHNAIMAGLNFATGEAIVMMDDDLQHSPKFVKSLYVAIKGGFDACFTKYNKTQQPFWKVIGSKFNDFAASILIKKPNDLYFSSFKAISKQVRDEIIKYDGPFTYLDGLIMLTTNRFTSIEVEHQKRFEGKGNYNFIRSLILWLKMSTGFSLLPLRLATFLGVGFSIVSFILSLYYLVLWFVTPELPRGWTTLILVVLFLGGIQLFSIGIIGEYIGRTYLKINKQPQFVIGDFIQAKKSQ